MGDKQVFENNIYESSCIEYSNSNKGIEEIIIDSLDVKSIYDVLPQLKEIAEFEKEHNIRCTLNRIKINRLND